MKPRFVDEFLHKARIPYTTFHHPRAFTAMQAAAASHVPGRCWAKTVVCYADAEPILVVLPAHYTIDFDQLRVLAGATSLRLATSSELCDLYPDCEEGAMPPFGDLYQQRVFAEASLVGEPEMVFSAGTHTDCVRMHYYDFVEIAHPIVGIFARSRSAPLASV
jgi:Ala-tRNA(Pro) deacylase